MALLVASAHMTTSDASVVVTTARLFPSHQ